MKREKKKEAIKLKRRNEAIPTFFDPDRESYLVDDAAGSVSHLGLTEALLVRQYSTYSYLIKVI
jgi:hypothetical protein